MVLAFKAAAIAICNCFTLATLHFALPPTAPSQVTGSGSARRTHVVCAMLAPLQGWQMVSLSTWSGWVDMARGLGAPHVKPHLIYLYRSCARLRRWPFHLLLTWTTRTTTRTTTITAAAAATNIKTTTTTNKQGGQWRGQAGGRRGVSVLDLLLAAASYLIVALIKLLSLLKGTF